MMALRERNHVDGRAHRYKAFCLCSSCDQQTRQRVAQFWTQTPLQKRKEMMIHLTAEKAERWYQWKYGDVVYGR